MGAVTLTDDQLIGTVEEIIRKVTRDPQAAVWPDRASQGRIGFVAVSTGFEKMTQVERQEKLFAAMKRKLGADMARIGMIFARTPAEIK